MPTDQEIRELCARALTSHNGEFETAIRELQSALRVRLQQLSNLTLATLLSFPKAAASIDENAEAEAAFTAEDDEAKASS